MIDFTNCERNRFRAYGGANGNKINIRYQGKSYMLKFPPKPRRGGEMSYTNGMRQRVSRLPHLRLSGIQSTGNSARYLHRQQE